MQVWCQRSQIKHPKHQGLNLNLATLSFVILSHVDTNTVNMRQSSIWLRMASLLVDLFNVKLSLLLRIGQMQTTAVEFAQREGSQPVKLSAKHSFANTKGPVLAHKLEDEEDIDKEDG